MKKSSKSLKIISTLLSVGFLLLVLNAAITLAISPFFPPVFEFKFNLKETGVFTATDGNAYPLTILPMKGIGWFEDGFQPIYSQNIYLFLLYGLALIFLFNFQRFIHSFTEENSFLNDNYKRL